MLVRIRMQSGFNYSTNSRERGPSVRQLGRRNSLRLATFVSGNVSKRCAHAHACGPFVISDGSRSGAHREHRTWGLASDLVRSRWRQVAGESRNTPNAKDD
jgi:hypothetical protein